MTEYELLKQKEEKIFSFIKTTYIHLITRVTALPGRDAKIMHVVALYFLIQCII